MQTQYMQQGYYPYAYAASAQQAGGMRKLIANIQLDFFTVNYTNLYDFYLQQQDTEWCSQT